jgi:hypothetical protein
MQQEALAAYSEVTVISIDLVKRKDRKHQDQLDPLY